MALLSTLMEVQTKFRPFLLSGEKSNTGTLAQAQTGDTIQVSANLWSPVSCHHHPRGRDRNWGTVGMGGELVLPWAGSGAGGEMAAGSS